MSTTTRPMPMLVRLEVAHSKANVKRVVLRHDAVIGRSADCNLRIASNQISRQHCKILLTDRGVMVRDLDSSNGTFLNGKRLQPNKDVPVDSGAQLSLGGVKFVVRYDTPAGGNVGKPARGEVPAAANGSSHGRAAAPAAPVVAAAGIESAKAPAETASADPMRSAPAAEASTDAEAMLDVPPVLPAEEDETDAAAVFPAESEDEPASLEAVPSFEAPEPEVEDEVETGSFDFTETSASPAEDAEAKLEAEGETEAAGSDDDEEAEADVELAPEPAAKKRSLFGLFGRKKEAAAEEEPELEPDDEEEEVVELEAADVPADSPAPAADAAPLVLSNPDDLDEVLLEPAAPVAPAEEDAGPPELSEDDVAGFLIDDDEISLGDEDEDLGDFLKSIDK